MKEDGDERERKRQNEEETARENKGGKRVKEKQKN